MNKKRLYISSVARKHLVCLFAWAIPDQRALELIAEHSPILEVGGGSGYWAFLLRDIGADVITTDKHPPDDGTNTYGHKFSFVDVRQATPDIAGEYPERALMLCWPPYSETVAYEALRAYEGDTLIYIGESRGGCTACDRFFDLLANEWKIESSHSIPQWDGLHDWLTVNRRK